MYLQVFSMGRSERSTRLFNMTIMVCHHSFQKLQPYITITQQRKKMYARRQHKWTVECYKRKVPIKNQDNNKLNKLPVSFLKSIYLYFYSSFPLLVFLPY